MSKLNAVSATLRFARFAIRPSLPALIDFFDTVNTLPAVTEPALAALRAREESYREFSRRARVGPIDLKVLEALPVGTLGHEFARHMRANQLDPAALPTRPGDTEEQYLWAHRYETHDIWHVLFGFGSDVDGELGVQAVYMAQLPMRSSLALVGMSLMRTMLTEFDKYEDRTSAIVRGWLLGRRARSLFGVDWKSDWREPLADVRRRYDIDTDGVDELLETWKRKPAAQRTSSE